MNNHHINIPLNKGYYNLKYPSFFNTPLNTIIIVGNQPPSGFSSWYYGNNIDNLNNITLSGNASIATWKDLGPDGRDLISTSSIKPQLTLSASYGLNNSSIRFSSSLAHGFFTQFAQESASILTIGVIYKFNGLAPNDPFLVGGGTGSNAFDLGHYEDFGSTNMYAWRGGAPFLRNETLTGSTYQYVVALYNNNGVSSKIIMPSGVEVIANIGTNATINQYTVGNSFSFYSFYGLTGEISEIVIYKEDKYSELITYLRSRTGL